MIINPLKVWVQNILPVVYDDSLSYLEVVSKINAKTNEIIGQTNENTHAIETLAEAIAELGDIEELRALLDEIENIVENLYTTDEPLMDGTASAGSADHAARSDHVHPSDTNKAPVNHASTENTYGIGDGTNYGHVKVTDDISNNDSGTAAKPIMVKNVNDKLSTLCRNNQVINGYFIGGNGEGGQFPINQRGLTNYVSGYTVDGWYSVSGSNSITVDETGLKITSGLAGGNVLIQYIENKEIFAGKTVTLSAVINNKLVTVTGIVPEDIEEWGTTILISPSVDNIAIALRTISSRLAVSIFASTLYVPNTEFTLMAVKLEFGDNQTLVHGNTIINEIPNYELELIKSQRYFQVFSSDALRPTYGIDCRPTMAKTTPTKSTIDINGTTYYTLSAE